MHTSGGRLFVLFHLPHLMPFAFASFRFGETIIGKTSPNTLGEVVDNLAPLVSIW